MEVTMKKNKLDRKIDFRVDQESFIQLNKLSNETGKRISQILRDALRNHFEMSQTEKGHDVPN
jgi:predicted DNA-binding protein